MSNEAHERAFSVPIGDPGSDRCCEWRWPAGEAVWNQSSKEGCSTYNDGPLTEEGRTALLSYFKLESRAEELTLERVRVLSPRELHELAVEVARTSGENEVPIPVSDRIGDRIPATRAA